MLRCATGFCSQPIRVTLCEVMSGCCAPSGQFFPIVVASCETHTGYTGSIRKALRIEGSLPWVNTMSPCAAKSDYTSCLIGVNNLCNQAFCLQRRLLLSDYGWTHLAQLKSAWRSLTDARLTPPDSLVVVLWACGRPADLRDLCTCYISLISPDAGASCWYSQLGVVSTSRKLAWRYSIAEDTNGMTSTDA